MRKKRSPAGSTSQDRPYHHGDLKNALATAALVQVTQKGGQNLSVREAARAVGVSHASAYRHFPNKDALLAEIGEQGFRLLTRAMQDGSAASGGDEIARFIACGIAYVDFAITHRQHLQVMFGGLIEAPDAHPGLVDASTAAFETLRAHVRAGKASGQIRNEDETVLAIAAWSQVHGFAQLIASGAFDIVAEYKYDPRALAMEILRIEGVGLLSETSPQAATGPKRDAAEQ